jgi:hypothetical protein
MLANPAPEATPLQHLVMLDFDNCTAQRREQTACDSGAGVQVNRSIHFLR